MTGTGADPRRLTVASERGTYPVILGEGLLAEAGRHIRAEASGVRRWAVLSDDRVGPLYGVRLLETLASEGLDQGLHTFPAGEAHKTRASWAALTDDLLVSGLGRDGGIVALGGGVAGDLAGFVAATYMRGVPVVQVPTSVVAMVDSAVGGKTGVDTRHGKNLVGAFHPPRAVLVDPATVATLPRAERAQGWAEAIKHGAILDEAYLGWLVVNAERLLDGDAAAVGEAVWRSIELKASVVARDERERGPREILNFGHTIGHALEAASAYALPHGSAVGLGMVLEARLGERLGVSEAGMSDRLREALQAFGLPVDVPDGLSPTGMMDVLHLDKKVRGERPRVVLPERPGSVMHDGGRARPVELADLRGLLEDAFQAAKASTAGRATS